MEGVGGRDGGEEEIGMHGIRTIPFTPEGVMETLRRLSSGSPVLVPDYDRQCYVKILAVHPEICHVSLIDTDQKLE